MTQKKPKSVAQYGIRWPLDVYKAMQQAAAKEMRSLPNWIKTVIVEKLKQEGLI